MKSRTLILSMLFVLLLFSVNSYANVYASHIEVSATELTVDGVNVVTISFILNEAADSGVDVKIYDTDGVLVRTISLSAGVKGVNTVDWDGTDDAGIPVWEGDYSFEITASDDGYTDWTKISDDLKTVMYSPKGIAINRDPNSPYFGRIYVANGYPGTSANAGAFYNNDGMYMFTPDQESYVFSDAGVDWSSSSNSPYKTTIGADGSIYVCDYGHDWLWQFAPDLTPESAKLILDDDNRVENQWVAANWVHGTGADRQIYTADAHYLTGQGIKMYAIGENELLLDGDTGVVVIERPNNGFYQNDVEVASDGSIFFSQKRSAKGEILDKEGKPLPIKAAGEAYPLMKYPAYTGTTMTIDDTLWTVPMTYTGADGIALDEAHNRVAWGDYYSGKVYVHDATTGELLWTVETGRNRTQDLAFDAAGNLYQADNSSEYWTILSPPDGANSYTTPGLEKISLMRLPSEYDGKIVINEFTYNSEYYDNEWVELYNASDETIDIVGWALRDAPDSHDPVIIPDTCDTELLPGEYFTIWTGGDGMDHGWPLHFTPDLNVAYDFATSSETTPIGLNNSGDILYLWDATGGLVDSVNFEDEKTFPDAARWGTGATCELIDPLADNNDPANWQASWFYGGTPGAANVFERPDYPKILITEVMYNSAGTDYEFIELMNGDVDTVDILGWWIMDDNPLHTKVPFPDTCDTKLGPGDFFTILVARGSDPGFTPDLDLSGIASPIGLNNDKENIILFNAGDSMVTYMHYDDGGSGEEYEHAHAADGSGPSLELVDLMGDPYDPQNWQASIETGGTPGYLNVTPAKLVAAEVTGETTVLIEYSEEVDSTTAVTLTNYVIDHGKGNPTAAVWMGNQVELTTSYIEWDTVYTVAVWNVEDLEGFAILDSSTISFVRESPDHEAPIAILARAMTDSTVIVDFDEELDSTYAVVLTNYTIDNSIGNPAAVKWLGDHVELALGSKLSLDANYTIIVNGVMDLYDNLKTEPDTLEFILKDFRGKIVINEFTWNSEYYDNEWIELYNASDETIDIAGWAFQNMLDPDILYIADTIRTVLAPGEFWTVWLFADPLSRGKDWPLHFTPDWNAAIDLTDSTKIHVFNLWNSGSDLVLYDDAGRLVDEVNYMEEETFPYQLKWGVGLTCERIDPALDGNDPASWQASWYYGGTPNAPNGLERPVYPKVVINEVMYNSADGTTEWVELKNLDNVAVDISGWWLRRDNPTLPKVGFQDGSVLQPGDLFTVLIDSIGGEDLGFVPNENYSDTSGIHYSNSRDNVILFNADDVMVTYMHYDDGATAYYEFEHCEGTDGGGKSLEYWNWELENWDPQAWAASKDSAGTPGAENYIYDIVPPVVDSAKALSDTTVAVWFSEDVNYTTATNKNNYMIDNGIGNPLYILQEENNKVILFLNPAVPLVEGTTYVVTVTGVRDIEGNEIAENNTASFVGIAVVGIDMVEAIPKVFALHNNYPNPFNPITTINYDLPKDANVRIVIYDLMGKEVRTLVNTHQKAGYQTIHWNALDNSGRCVSSGFYFYVMDAGNFHKAQKMLLLK
ncbi:MAG: hypothetical protein DRP96_03595 [Candidatus Neomarinimicrobiota bacterium]|nr:MAG: hypothetical protein DRP96_03595 [Candidatus Neomarinimicrobiota bacterium]